MLRLHSMSHMGESIYFETEIFVVMRKIWLYDSKFHLSISGIHLVHRISNLIIAKSLKK